MNRKGLKCKASFCKCNKNKFEVKGLKRNPPSCRVCRVDFMALLTNITILLVLACVSHQMIVGVSHRGHGRRGRGDRGQHKERSGQKSGRRPKTASAFQTMGKWVTKDRSECTWTAAHEDLVTLNITCKNAERSFGCEYTARPSVCPQYSSSKELFWVQILRALKKQKNLCRDDGGSLRAGVCKRAGREAHFRLRAAQKVKTTSSSIPPFAPRAVKSCQPDNRKLAEEHCSDSWSSLCTFFFTMVKDSDCWSWKKFNLCRHNEVCLRLACITQIIKY